MRHVCLLSFLFVFAGCSSGGADGPDASAGDGWEWGTDGSTAAPDDPEPRSESGFCATLAEHVSRCGGNACTDRLVDDCDALAGIVNEEVLRLAEACLSDGGGLGTCLVDAVRSIAPRDAHRSFAATFCSECASFGAAQCETAFFDGSGDTSVAGTIVLPFGDAVVSRIEAECTGGLTCAVEIQGCAQRVLAEEGLPERTAGCFLTGLVSLGEADGDCGGSLEALEDAGTSAAPDGGVAPAGDAGISADDGGTGEADAGPADDGGTDGGTTSCADGYEPNDTRTSSYDLGSIDDRSSYPTGWVEGALEGAELDWYRYAVDDRAFGVVGPRVRRTAGDVQLCAYYACDSGDGSAACGTSDGSASTAGDLEGCCAGASGEVRLVVDCPGWDDSGTVQVRVAGGAPSTCTDYAFDWGDD